ncbi:hypothetical protein DEU56DRAFT_758859 [Suillus clintonianus]|uniref:uncharacterized protein n=1 Tax=Suillus clintonianus TaxID=1904413 RepID=UPI001B8692A0|nr:uncharacterized protein DEU56DRAFT_758859 [Suillus clintonianus]KAG2126615.1 hypothetical protein DEU56DRAFT_758859 [Suillus clintonianus]
MQNYNIEVDLNETERMRYLEEITTSNDATDLGCASMTLEYEGSRSCTRVSDNMISPRGVSQRDQHGSKPTEMGEVLARRAKYLLDGGIYPGDQDPWGLIDPERFLVYCISQDEYIIMDREARLDPELTVPTPLLKNPNFQLEGWYAQHVGEQQGMRPKEVRQWRRLSCDKLQRMGTPFSDRAVQLLGEHGAFLKDPPDYTRSGRFECVRLTEGVYKILDLVLAYKVTVPESLVENPKFEVSNWYEKRLAKTYEALYDELNATAQEYDILRLLDRGELSEDECQLDDVVRSIYTPAPDAQFLYNESHLFVIELNGQQIPAVLAL